MIINLDMQRLLRLPKIRIYGVLLLLVVLSFWHFSSLGLLVRFLLITFITLTLEYIFWKIRGITPFLPSAGLVTASIIYLLADSSAPPQLVALAIVAAVLAKQFIRAGNRHIFNPAAFGLLIASFFGLAVTWWGVSWGLLALLVIIAGGARVIFFTLKQHLIVLPFLLTSVLISIFYLGNLQQTLLQFEVGSFWFFTMIMLPEPLTAAHLSKTRIVYGVLVATLPFIFAYFHLPLDALLASLLFGNLITFIVEKTNKPS